MSNDFEFLSFADMATINPGTSTAHLQPDDEVSFIPMSDVTETGQWNVQRVRKLHEVKNGYTSFREGDVLFAKITPCMENGKGAHAIGLVNGVGFGTTEFHVLRAKLPNDASFIYHWSQSEELRRRAEARMTGSAGQQRVPTEFFEQYKVPLLKSHEQQRIAHILDIIDTQIQETEKLIAKLKLMKVGLLHDLLTCGIDEHGDVRDPIAHPEQFKDSELGRIPIPREWEIDYLLNHVSLPNGQLDPRQVPYRDWPLIAPDHIESETGRLLSIQTAAQQNAISGKYRFQPGDVLYSKIRPYLKKAVLASQEGLCSADMYPLRSMETIVPRFLLGIILGEHFSQFAIAVSSRSGFPKINREELAEYKCALPPYKEQTRIVSVLNSHDARIASEEAQLEKLRHIKRGLMHDLLTGRVRVPHDEHYASGSGE